MENSEDDRGNYRKAAEQTVSTELAESFFMYCPVIKGGEDKKFEVHIHFDVQGNDLVIYLESPQYDQLLRDEFRAVVENEVKEIEKVGGENDGYYIIYV